MSTETPLNMVVFIITVYKIIDISKGNEIETTIPYEFENGEIHCNANENCKITCNQDASCRNTDIYCPNGKFCELLCIGDNYNCYQVFLDCSSSNDCKVTCDGINACDHAQIKWPNNNEDELICKDQNSCSYTNFPIPPPNKNYELTTCDKLEECRYSTMTCPLYADCEIRCDALRSCHGSKIIWSITSKSINSVLSIDVDPCIYCTKPPIYSIDDVTDYSLTCTEQTCYEAVVYCPKYAECHITCPDEYACYGTAFIWPKNHLYSLNCVDAASCRGLIYTPYYNNQPFIMNCSTAPCQAQIIKCPSDASCIFTCDGFFACSKSVVNCPSNSQCSVTCNDWRSCEGAVFNGIGTVSQCTGSSSCHTMKFPQPPSNIDYTLVCGDVSSCMSATIRCPKNADCIIRCMGQDACKDANIIWSTNPTVNSTLICGSATGACNNTNVPPINYQYSVNDFADYNLVCSSNSQCANSIIDCPLYAKCDIMCSGQYSCKNTIVNGGNDILNIICSNTGSCYNAEIYAQNASSLTITNCTAIDSCKYMTAWFPIYDDLNDNPRAVIDGMTDIGLTEVIFYAVRGWKDILITNYIYDKYGVINHIGKMFCGLNDYDMFCNFATNGWQCHPYGDIRCNDVIMPTLNPTTNPTPSPTTNPTPSPTDHPTPSPTDNPTPVPADNPTPSPTGNPTPSPTDNPTPSPTDNPTPSPTVVTAAPTSDTVSPTTVTFGPTSVTVSPSADTQSPTSITIPPTAVTEEPTQSPFTPGTPTQIPTDITVSPSNNPTSSPTDNPTPSPTDVPIASGSETNNPTPSPTDNPTASPADHPTASPADHPTASPTNNPTSKTYPDTTQPIKSTINTEKNKDGEGEAGQGISTTIINKSADDESVNDTFNDATIPIKMIIIILLVCLIVIILCVIITWRCLKRKKQRNTKMIKAVIHHTTKTNGGVRLQSSSNARISNINDGMGTGQYTTPGRTTNYASMTNGKGTDSNNGTVELEMEGGLSSKHSRELLCNNTQSTDITDDTNGLTTINNAGEGNENIVTGGSYKANNDMNIAINSMQVNNDANSDDEEDNYMGNRKVTAGNNDYAQPMEVSDNRKVTAGNDYNNQQHAAPHHMYGNRKVTAGSGYNDGQQAVLHHMYGNRKVTAGSDYHGGGQQAVPHHMYENRKMTAGSEYNGGQQVASHHMYANRKVTAGSEYNGGHAMPQQMHGMTPMGPNNNRNSGNDANSDNEEEDANSNAGSDNGKDVIAVPMGVTKGNNNGFMPPPPPPLLPSQINSNDDNVLLSSSNTTGM